MSTYTLKYYHTHTRGGHTITLNIYQRDLGTYTAKKMAHLCGLTVGLDGGQNEIYAPITKSVLAFSLVDASDIADTVEDGVTVKHGGWEEFFTPDSTLYKVELVQDGSLRWSGYITPDSWSEDLTYHGVVTIQARDNIGHLQDMDFDAAGDTYGMISVDDLIRAAGDKIGQTFNLAEDLDSLSYFYPNGSEVEHVNIWDLVFDVRAFDDMTWYDVLEDVLQSLGLCLRWQDNDEFMVSTISGVPTSILDYSHPEKQAVFVNGSGHRDLNPAYKKLTDVVSFDFPDGETLKIDGYKSATYTKSGVDYPVSKMDGKGWTTLGDMLTISPDLSSYWGATSGWNAEDCLLLQAMTANPGASKYIRKAFKAPTSQALTLSFKTIDGYEAAKLFDSAESTGATGMLLRGNQYATTVRYAITWVPYDGTATQYLTSSGTWSTSSQLLTKQGSTHGGTDGYQGLFENEVEHSFTTPSTPGELCLTFYFALLPGVPIYVTGDLYFVIVRAISLELGDTSVVEKNTINTVYDEKYNMTLERDLKLGQYPGAITAGTVTNAIFANVPSLGYPSITGTSDGSQYFQDRARYGNLSEMFHRELLCYLGTAASILSGELMDDTDDDPHFNDTWLYGDKRLYIVGGSLDLLTGRIENAYLQEYLNFDDVWGDGLAVEIPSGIDVTQGYDFEMTVTSEIPWTLTLTPTGVPGGEAESSSYGGNGKTTVNVTGDGCNNLEIEIDMGSGSWLKTL